MKKSVIVLALVLAVAVPLSAQVSQTTVLTYQVIKEEWNSLVADAMELTPEEAKVFWPLYHVYNLEMTEVEDRRVSLIKRYVEELPTMSDELALEMLAEDFAIHHARVDIEERYAPAFAHVLPGKKVLRLFQVENRLRAVVNMQIMKDVPLAD